MAADPTYGPKVHCKAPGDVLEIASGGSIVADAGSSVTLNGALLSTSPSAGIGYGTGAGGAATQTTNRSTSVTLNGMTGKITTDTTSLAAAGEAEFKVANSSVGANDVVIVNLATAGGTGTPQPYVSGVAAGAFSITLTNLHASTADTSADVINFVVIKGANS